MLTVDKEEQKTKQNLNSTTIAIYRTMYLGSSLQLVGGQQQHATSLQYKPAPGSPMTKFQTPQKTRAEMLSLKDEVEDLRSQLRAESARKKAVLKDIELQTRQLQASEARLRVMESKLKDLAQSKHTLAAEKATSDKELLQLKAKWDSAARKLDKIHETVARAQSKIATAEKERALAEQRVSQLNAELISRKAVETQCIQLNDKLLLATRHVEQLQMELASSKEALETAQSLDRTSEETQSQLYALACTVSQLRGDLEIEMNYSTSRKTELAILQVEKARIETLLLNAKSDYETSLASWESDREILCHKAMSAHSQLETLTLEYEHFRASRDAHLVQLDTTIRDLQEQIVQRDTQQSEYEHKIDQLELTYQALVEERDGLLSELEQVGETLKTRQLENRRLVERVNFLETAMEYLKGEMSVQKDELTELKTRNVALQERLVQQDSDLQSAQAAQIQLANSLREANERIEELERTLLAAKHESETNQEQVRGELEMTQIELKQAHFDAAEAQRLAKEDLEAMKFELAAEKMRYEHSCTELEERAKCHKVLEERHESLKAAYETVTSSYEMLENKYKDAEKQHQEVVESRQNIFETHDALQASHDQLKCSHESLVISYETVKKDFDERFQHLADSKSAEQEMIAHNQTISAQKAHLEAQLEQLSAQLVLSKESVLEQQVYVAQLKEEVSLLTEAALNGSQQIATLEAQLLESTKQLADMTLCKETLDENVNSLKSDVLSLTQTQFELEKSLQEAQADCHSTSMKAETQLRELQDSSNDVITTLKTELNVALESALDLMTLKSELAEEHSVAQARISQLENEVLAISQTESRLLESQRVSMNQITELRVQLKNQTDLVDTTKDEYEKQLRILEECHHGRLEVLKTQHHSQIEEMHEAHAAEMKRLTNVSNKQIETLEIEHDKQIDSLKQTIEELKQSLGQIEQDSNSKSARLTELEQATQQLSSQLGASNELLGEIQMEKNLAEVNVKTLKSELAQYTEQLTETDAALASLQSENVSLKSERESMKKAVDAQLAQLKREKQQWVALAESQKNELEETLSLLKSAQDEVDAMKAQYEVLKTSKEAEEKEINDLRVKKLSHEIRMISADLSRQKGRIQTREAAISASKAREEKLQSNLDAQIEKCRDLQRQLADKEREQIIERGRARTSSKSAPSVSSSSGHATNAAASSNGLANVSSSSGASTGSSQSSSSSNEFIPTVEDLTDLNVQLIQARAEITRLTKQLEVEKSQMETMIVEQTKLTGHNNTKQKIQFSHKLMKENHELKLERANLLALLEKRGFASPHRKSLTRSIVRPAHRVALASLNASTTTSMVDPSATTTSATTTITSTSVSIPASASSATSTTSTCSNDENMAAGAKILTGNKDMVAPHTIDAEHLGAENRLL